jgi:hypothetical protein
VNNTIHSVQAWRDVHARVVADNDTLVIPKTTPFPHPRDAGARLTTTWPVGQIADYLLELELGATPLLVREFIDRYEAFVTSIQLTERAIQLVEANPTAALFVGGALLGASVGTALTRTRDGALIGAGVGVLVVALLRGPLHRNTEKV